jgi:hypothetical protein
VHVAQWIERRFLSSVWCQFGWGHGRGWSGPMVSLLVASCAIPRPLSPGLPVADI